MKEATPPAIAPSSAAPRIALLDVVRGFALIGMAIFHGAWDVAYVRLFRFDPGESVGWTIFARLIAGTFLILAGIGLVLSTRNGFRRRPYFRRLAMIVGAAVLVSAATWWFLPDGWIFFGILHEIALASVLGLLFVQLPAVATLIAALVFFALPHLYTSELFDVPALWWVGLAPLPPPSFDYVPLFPWFGDVLVGIALARAALARKWDRRLAEWTPGPPPLRWLAFAGRHSLAVYLIHQPLLFGLAFGLAAIFVPHAAEDAARADCEDRCATLGHTQAVCASYCGCVFTSLRTAGLADAAFANKMTPAEIDRFQALTKTCRDTTLPTEQEPGGSLE